MSESYTATASTTIDAPLETVWDALTDPETIQQYFFGATVENNDTEEARDHSEENWEMVLGNLKELLES